ncbi:MAG: DNA-protecting protein DprA [Parachlamydiaceae bacterium]|nr:DNA-protecting protein DprA [Parachlamydiaceae bacterium]
MLTELDALIILTTIPHLGSVRIRLLLQHYGSALNALQTDAASIAQLPDFGPKIAEGWLHWKHSGWQDNLELAQKLRVDIVPFTSNVYPKALLELPDYPVVLYMKGTLKPRDQQSIAVIGTRQASIYGLEMAKKISSDLALSGFTVVSGLARGIDTAAHEGALVTGRTIAVIGSGLADIYPRENSRLAERVSENGVLISEFPMATPPDRQNFPQRNRIVAGMTRGTFLVEAPLKSGAMITVDRALTYKRKLFALPGRIDQGMFQGNHHVIKTRQGQLVENATDIVNSFDDLFSLVNTTKTTQLPTFSLGKEEQEFMSVLPKNELSIDEIVQLTKLPVMRVNVLLMSLVLKKAMKEFPGRMYKRAG